MGMRGRPLRKEGVLFGDARPSFLPCPSGLTRPIQLARASIHSLSRLLQLTLVGTAVGMACWPLNQADRWQDALLQRLPGFGGSWERVSLMLALAPLLAMPLLLLLQNRLWSGGAGGGIPQLMLCLRQPQRTLELMAPAATLQRLALWSMATFALLPLGREGPVVQLGGAVLVALRQRFPELLGWMDPRQRLAVAGAAGLAAGFNTPLVAVVFLVEELIGRFVPALVWPGLVVALLAALISALGGQPEFAFGILREGTLETRQFLWAVPFGLLAGLLGALLSLLILRLSARFLPLAQRHPVRLGLALGAALALLALISGGSSGGDGATLMQWLVNQELGGELPHPLGPGAAALTLLVRLLGPALALAVGVPGGLIDPALAIGALLGSSLGAPLGMSSLGLALAMTASLSGATQLPVMSLLFTLRLAGDQQLLPGLALASVLGAGVGRLLMNKGINHLLAERLSE